MTLPRRSSPCCCADCFFRRSARGRSIGRHLRGRGVPVLYALSRGKGLCRLSRHDARLKLALCAPAASCRLAHHACDRLRRPRDNDDRHQRPALQRMERQRDHRAAPPAPLAIIIYKHRDNLVRNVWGTEIGLRSAHRGDPPQKHPERTAAPVGAFARWRAAAIQKASEKGSKCPFFPMLFSSPPAPPCAYPARRVQRPADDAPAVLPCVQEQSDGVRAVRQEGDTRARARALEIKILAGGGNEDREARVDLVAAVGEASDTGSRPPCATRRGSPA